MRIDAIWLALGVSDLRGGIDSLLALVLRKWGFKDGELQLLRQAGGI